MISLRISVDLFNNISNFSNRILTKLLDLESMRILIDSNEKLWDKVWSKMIFFKFESYWIGQDQLANGLFILF